MKKCNQCEGVKCENYLQGRIMQREYNIDGVENSLTDVSFLPRDINHCLIREKIHQKILDKLFLYLEKS